MDIRPGTQTKKVTDIQVAKKELPSVLLTLEEEYGEWLTVPPEEEMSSEKEVFVPPVFEYVPKKKKKLSLERMDFSWKKASIFLGGIILVYIVSAAIVLWTAKDTIEQKGELGFQSIEKAKDALVEEKYDLSLEEFKNAEKLLGEARAAIPFWTAPVMFVTGHIPGLTEGASAESVLDAGIAIARSGPDFVQIVGGLERAKQEVKVGREFSLLAFFDEAKMPLARAQSQLELAKLSLEKVRLEDIPEEKQKNFRLAKEALPVLLGMIETFGSHEAVIQELLGAHGPRKYLFLLENNHELRATGGFIGTYALLEMNDGTVKNFFVDGIFNPDGQLRENIVPPKPLQKISAGWSLHDSNWFPDFPTSAEKAIFFYEKTGGPTVDGVMTITPTVMLKLLEITGPIELPEYDITVTHENFFPAIQTEVEVNYDKEENKPKQVLADLSQILFARLLETRDEKTLLAIAEIMIESLNEKHMLLYVRDERVENIVRNAGWSGEIKSTDKDYLSVVHSNINGYKTDGVLDDSIEHKVEIKDDGRVIDTVRITRTHNGGKTLYDWWNRVNANYMRVYVPFGSKLISAKGHTYEFPESPLDYDALGFKRDATVEAIEKTEQIDEESGTRVSEESGKTVFGNWVYVSPGEKVTVEYVYELPFRVTPGRGEIGASSYSMLYQKQAGTIGTKIESEIVYPKAWKPIWQTGQNLVPYEHTFRVSDTLTTDLFLGMTFDDAP
ncbi:MAG: DUF4012 domain-containing protein [Candidatus Moranbacteria bacterium]|nr:DUF4012 domain-containing protein [Candidatus Moranbacteria bacterium]